MKRLAAVLLLLCLAAGCGPQPCPTPAGAACLPERFTCSLASPALDCTCTKGVLVCRTGDGGTP